MCQTVIHLVVSHLKKQKQNSAQPLNQLFVHSMTDSFPVKCRMKTEGYHLRNEQTSVCLVEVIQSSLLGTDVTLLEWQIGNDWSNRVFPSSWVIFHMFTFAERTWEGGHRPVGHIWMLFFFFWRLNVHYHINMVIICFTRFPNVQWVQGHLWTDPYSSSTSKILARNEAQNQPHM